jgi:hypothetical protein
MAFDILSKANVEQFQAAIEVLKEELSKCFTEKEQTNSVLSLIRSDGHPKNVDLFSASTPEDLISYVKYNTNAYYQLTLSKSRFIAKMEHKSIAAFRLAEMPGCCGVVISTGAWTDPKFQKRGIGTALNKFRMAIAKAIGYSTMMCTAVDDGITEKILGRNGWTKTGTFVNRRTNNKVSVFSVFIPLVEEAKKN